MHLPPRVNRVARRLQMKKRESPRQSLNQFKQHQRQSKISFHSARPSSLSSTVPGTKRRRCFVRINQASRRFSGYTSLHCCSHYNEANAATVLIKHYAPLEMEDVSRRCPIYVAVAQGSSDL
mmetsp:Transcript_20333/g.28992  ORF Transcript_20333/g.28992 Transcript_20333/m.28992 type:complete len:122 (+) Transcript_20333:144-509(+)